MLYRSLYAPFSPLFTRRVLFLSTFSLSWDFPFHGVFIRVDKLFFLFNRAKHFLFRPSQVCPRGRAALTWGWICLAFFTLKVLQLTGIKTKRKKKIINNNFITHHSFPPAGRISFEAGRCCLNYFEK